MVSTTISSHDLHLVVFHVPLKYQIKHQIFSTNQEENKENSLDDKPAELLLHLKTSTYINNTCTIYCADIYIS